MILKNKDIVIIGLQAWDNEIGSNCIDIALQFSKHNRVLYVNYPLNRRTIVKEKNSPLVQKRLDLIRNKKENLFQVKENLWNLYPSCILESVNWMPSTTLFNLVNRVNNARFAREIKKAIERLHFKDFILFNDSDMFRGYFLKEMLKPALSVYYTRDNLIGFPYFRKHGTKLEPRLMSKSNLIVANSVYLADVARKYNPNSYYVGQGCELEQFSNTKTYPLPSDIAHIKKPIIGYIGALLSIRLNLPLLEELAAANPQWNFVFVGPQDNDFKNSKLHQMSNVHFPGLKQMKELPDYLAHFDVAVNPQVLNEVTIGNYPRKVDEYLAMGKPVVATETKAMSIFSEHVYFANTAAEYATKIEQALKEDNEEKHQQRAAFAQSHTWENSVAEIYKAMQTVKPELMNS